MFPVILARDAVTSKELVIVIYERIKQILFRMSMLEQIFFINLSLIKINGLRFVKI